MQMSETFEKQFQDNYRCNTSNVIRTVANCILSALLEYHYLFLLIQVSQFVFANSGRYVAVS